MAVRKGLYPSGLPRLAAIMLVLMIIPESKGSF